MKTLIRLTSAALLALCATAAFAQSGIEASIKKTLEPRLGEGVKVDSITRTPYSGLYEVRIGNDIFYTDAKGEYLFLGRIVDTKNFQDHTKARLDEINRIKFDELPFESALKMVRGNGKRVIAVFEDPNCGYCKRFRQTLNQMDNVTVYTFMYNILSEDSAVKSRNVWCSADRNKAWDDWMLNGKVPASAPANCTAPNEAIRALGQRLNVTGTPTIFFTDGSRIPGAIDAKGLESKLTSIK
ncbi:MAG TPA: DsbC family protein [Noviherbaspirillum sp.]|nr:DsbC family protein [Noviherbaspirillum sp.]